MKVKFVGKVSQGIVWSFTGEWVVDQVYDVDDELGQKLLETGQFEKVEEVRTTVTTSTAKWTATVPEMSVTVEAEGGEQS